METTKERNIKNRTYYFYNDIINLDEFDEGKIKVDKNDFNDIDIYYLYLTIVDMKGHFKKGKNDAWYLVISDKDDVYEKLMDIFEIIKKKIEEKTWDVVQYGNDYIKIKFESNNIYPTDKDVNIHLATIVIRAIFAKDDKYYPQLFLDDGLYKKRQCMKESIF